MKKTMKKIVEKLEKLKTPQKIRIHFELGRLIFEMNGEKYYVNVNKEDPDPDHLIGTVMEFQVEKLKSKSVKAH